MKSPNTVFGTSFHTDSHHTHTHTDLLICSHFILQITVKLKCTENFLFREKLLRKPKNFQSEGPWIFSFVMNLNRYEERHTGRKWMYNPKVSIYWNWVRAKASEEKGNKKQRSEQQQTTYLSKRIHSKSTHRRPYELCCSSLRSRSHCVFFFFFFLLKVTYETTVAILSIKHTFSVSVFFLFCWMKFKEVFASVAVFNNDQILNAVLKFLHGSLSIFSLLLLCVWLYFFLISDPLNGVII